uniref:Mitochondrial carrier protein n=1 Tax=Leptocylindrus danicus TaxID=163516 RepID=A0A7S2KKU5_9STRA
MDNAEVKTVPSGNKGEAMKNFVAGAIGGVCCVAVGHPFDLVKVRMQTLSASSGPPPFTGTFDCLLKTARAEGIRGVYRGVTAPLVAVTPIFAVNFWGYEMGQQFVRYFDKESDHNKPLTLTQLIIAGSLSSLPTTLITAPSERIKCVMQVQANLDKGAATANRSMMSFAKEIYKESGIRGIFKGTGATLLRDAPGCAVYFGSYEFFKKELCRLQSVDPSELSPGISLTAGGLAGMFMWSVVLPIDVLKSRFQTSPEGMYKGMGDVYRHLIREEGYGALFKGVGPAMIRAFPANAAVFLGVEVTKKAWDNFLG